MIVRIKYFASLRDMAGRDEEKMTVTPGETGATLFTKLVDKYGFTLKPDQILLVVNDEYQKKDIILKDQDLVIFIPPVSGG